MSLLMALCIYGISPVYFVAPYIVYAVHEIRVRSPKVCSNHLKITHSTKNEEI